MLLLLAIPRVQTGLGNYITTGLNKRFNTQIDVGQVSLRFNGDVALKNIYIEDYKNDTLINIATLHTSILSLKNLYNGQLTFGDIDINGLTFNIKKYSDSEETNLDIFVKKLEGDTPKTGTSHFLLSSNDVTITDGKFRFGDAHKSKRSFIDFRDLNIHASQFLIEGSTVSTRINSLSFNDQRGIRVKNLRTDFKYTLKSMTFEGLNIETPHSLLKGRLTFDYKREDLRFFTDKVQLTAQLRDSKIDLAELRPFYDGLGSSDIHITTDLSGTLNNLTVNNLNLHNDQKTHFEGVLNFKHLFGKTPNRFFMTAQINDLKSNYNDLTRLLPKIMKHNLPPNIEHLGDFFITGSTTVTGTTLAGDVAIKSELGAVNSNLKITQINNVEKAIYEGTVVFDDFDLGTFFEDATLGNVSLNLAIKGTGFLSKSIDTEVKGSIESAFFNGYQYQNSKISGRVKNKIFDGNLITNDANLKLNFNGLIDFSEAIKKYDFQAQIKYANLKALHFVKKDSLSLFESRVKINLNASNLDDAYGDVVFSNTRYQNEHNTYFFKKLQAHSKFDKDSVRLITINSPDIIKGSVKGRFEFGELKNLFENALGSIYTNYVSHSVKTDQYINFNFAVYSKILEVFFPDIKIAKNTTIRGIVKSNAKAFKLQFKSPEVRLKDNFAKRIAVQIDNENALFNTYIEFDSLRTKHYKISKFNLINATINDTLFMRSEFRGGKKNNDIFNLSFYHTINNDNESVVGFKKSDVTLKGNKWFINESKDRLNKIFFNKSLTKLAIDQVRLTHKASSINISGNISDTTEKDIKLLLKDIDLETITPDIEQLTLAGNVNGAVHILEREGRYLSNSEISIDRLKVNTFPLGAFNASINSKGRLTEYDMVANLKNDESNSFSAVGSLDIGKNNGYIDLDLKFADFNLKPLNPLLKGVFSNIRGTTTGRAAITGAALHPDIQGRLTLNNAGLSIPYLNVDYQFDEETKIGLQKQEFNFNNIAFTDTKHQSRGRLNGKLTHNNLSNWQLGLQIDTQRLLILDTEETETSRYYGTGFIGGRADITGPSNELAISVTGQTKAGTVFKIPIKDSESFGDNTYIHFITKAEKEARAQGKTYTIEKVKGLELNFDLDITEDAEVEIIMDKSTGHAIKGRGRGGILVEINTNGKFNMWGDFSVFEGVYNFAYGDLIQREFSVEPGGTIAWEGKPLKALINMLAVYKTQANPSPLLDTPINRNIPVELNINIVGELDHLEPNFSFRFPNVGASIKSELQYQLESRDNRQNQALYLLSTGSFSTGLDDLNFSGTFAERLNNIINGIFSNDDSKFNFGLNYEVRQKRPDYQTNDRLWVTLQTNVSHRVLINGKVGVPVGAAGASENVVVGDVEIEFILNSDGTLSAKVFNRENNIRNFAQAIGYTQGVGLSYNLDFDSFKELLQHLLKPKKKNTTNSENKTRQLPRFINLKPNPQATP